MPKSLKGIFREFARSSGIVESAFAPFFELLHAKPRVLSKDLIADAGFTQLLERFLAEKNMSYVFVVTKPGVRVPEAFCESVIALMPHSFEERLQEHFVRESILVPFAFLACFFVIAISFRNIWLALLSSIPPLCSFVCILLWMVFSGHAVTLSALAAIPLVLGLASDHGIMVTYDILCGVRSGVERAVVVSTLTTLTGMGLLALCEHPALRAMGEVIFFGLLVEIPAALFILPRVCRGTNQKKI